MELSGMTITEVWRGRELLIYLPPSYPFSQTGFPVAYVHDRGDLFDPGQNDCLLRLERMFAAGELRELILVGVEPRNRIHEYTPWFANALSAQRGYGDFGGKGNEYLALLAKECKPYIDRSYHTIKDREHTGIIGKSLGGLISLYCAYVYPDVFGKIGSISGSLWYEGFVEFMRAKTVPRPGLSIYMDVGSLEGTDKTSIQKETVARTKEAYSLLAGSGFTEETLTLRVEAGGVHENSCFFKRFPEALRWLFGGQVS